MPPALSSSEVPASPNAIDALPDLVSRNGNMPTLKQPIESLAQHFAAEVLTLIRSASLEDILGHDVGATRTAKVAKGTRADQGDKRRPRPKPTKAPRRRGRLARRSADQIQAQLTSVVALLKKSPEGLRSEEIRDALKLDRREVPRVLAEGLKGKALRKSGAKTGHDVPGELATLRRPDERGVWVSRRRGWAAVAAPQRLASGSRSAWQ